MLIVNLRIHLTTRATAYSLLVGVSKVEIHRSTYILIIWCAHLQGIAYMLRFKLIYAPWIYARD